MSQQTTLDGDIINPNTEKTGCCDRCDCNGSIETHHIMYVPEKCVELCKECHSFVHQNPSSPYAPQQNPDDLFSTASKSCKAPDRANVTIKRINNNPYFYWNWRVGENVMSEYICSVDEAKEHSQYVGNSK